MNYSILINI